MNKNDVLLREYVKLYELALSYEGKTPATLRIYLMNLGHFCRYLEERLQQPPALSHFTTDAVVAYVMDLKHAPSYENHPYKTARPQPISPATIDQRVRTLKGFSTWLYEKRYTRTNILKLLPRPKQPQLTIEPLTDDEVKRMLASIDTRCPYGARNYAIIVALLDTGLRLSELCYLKTEDVHLDGRHCHVKVLGKGQKERIVYLGRRAHEALLTYNTFVRPHHAKDPAVMRLFLTIRGRPLNPGAVEHMIASVGKGAGIPRVHAHLLRHTAATQYLVHGGDVLSLQRKLGHAGLEMTNRYAHLASDQLAVIQERVAPMDKIDIKPMRVPKAR
jgi:site-specific recombinase XerD